MNINDLEHIAIRSPKYVAGTTKQPKIDLFVQTHKKYYPIKESNMSAGQTVWMKWSGGPIVANAKLLSWHHGHFENSNINEIRNLAIHTRLFSINSYWESVAEKKEGYYTILFLTDERWLNPLIYPEARASGSSWIYLDTNEKKKLWLTNHIEQQVKENDPKSRSIPTGLRFDVLMRDNFTCQYCGKSREKYPELEIEVDHKTPWRIVKEHKLDNLQVLCWDCNRGKSDKIVN